MEQILTRLADMDCDVSGALRRFANNERLYLKYVNKFPTDDTVLKFWESFKCGDYETARNEIHAYKGLSGNLGFTEQYTLSQEIMRLISERDYQSARKCADMLLENRDELICIITA